MQRELEQLGAALCRSTPPVTTESEADLSALIRDAIVVLPAGGFGYRMRSVSETGGVTQKSLLPLPNGETLIGRVVRQYAETGFRRFVALVNYEGKAVEEHLAGGTPWNVVVRVSYDPQETGSGRTGAMLHAMDRGILPEDGMLVVHNADCHVFNYPGSFPLDLLRAHLHASGRGEVAATLAAVDGTPYPFTGMSIAEGRVTDVAMYPFIPVPTHTGITVLAPAALRSIRENAATSKKNFESDLFPRWAAEGRLAAMVMSHAQWVAVDDRKSYRQFCQAVAEEKGSS